MISDRLLAILACPVDKEAVKLEDEHVVCIVCGRRYPIRRGIPVMLVDQPEIPSKAEDAAR